jgi:hypothetical protein
LLLVACWMTIAAAVAVGAIRLVLDFARQSRAPERPMMAFVAGHHSEDEVYLTPVKMQDFRLVTGSPVYVEFKSIPYRDLDVLEWYRRIHIADRIYKEGDCVLLASLSAEEKVTHVVWEKDSTALVCPGLVPVYEDVAFGVYKIDTK